MIRDAWLKWFCIPIGWEKQEKKKQNVVFSNFSRQEAFSQDLKTFLLLAVLSSLYLFVFGFGMERICIEYREEYSYGEISHPLFP